MTEHKLLAEVLRECAELRKMNEDHLLAGGVRDYAEYRHVAGVIRGLTLAENAVKDLVHKMEQN
jgi:hypothetical protein